MLDLRRLKLLHELHQRGTIAAVADALRFTPSAVSQQLATLERETGVTLLTKQGRGVQLTDAALVLVDHARDLLAAAERAEADLAAAASATPAGRGRIAAFQSVALNIATPAIAQLARTAPQLRTELIDAEPEDSLPALALGDLDLVLADEWAGQPLPRLAGVDRHDLHVEPVLLVLPKDHPAAKEHRREVPLKRLRHEAWVGAPPGGGWESLILRTCRDHGGFDPEIRHRSNDAIVACELVAHGQAVTLLPELTAPEQHPGVAIRRLADADVHRTIIAATRTADAQRPSTRALLDAVKAAGRARGWR
jgi:DNA-binding transcriptional LysR family regulator